MAWVAWKVMHAYLSALSASLLFLARRRVCFASLLERVDNNIQRTQSGGKVISAKLVVRGMGVYFSVMYRYDCCEVYCIAQPQPQPAHNFRDHFANHNFSYSGSASLSPGSRRSILFSRFFIASSRSSSRCRRSSRTLRPQRSSMVSSNKETRPTQALRSTTRTSACATPCRVQSTRAHVRSFGTGAPRPMRRSM